MSIQITADQKTKLNAFRTEAYAPLADAQQAASEFKDIVDAAAEATGVDKKIIGKFFKLAFKDSIRTSSEEMDVIKFLSE